MYLFLLIVIYLSFVGLGLPEPVLGSLWPIMRTEFAASLDFAGVISLIMTVSKTLSGLITDRIDKKIGHGCASMLSMLVMALSLYGCAVSRSEYMICLFTLPLGIASGIIDTAINDYVSRNFSSRHMSWLHCSWGIGSMLSPFAIGFLLSCGRSWRAGYVFVATVQIVITILLLISLPHWKKISDSPDSDNEITVLPIKDVVRLPGIVFTFLALFSYCGAEVTASLWSSSFLVEQRGLDAETAATCTSAFFIGITLGRFLSSFIADKLGDLRMAKTGAVIAFAGALVMFIPGSTALLPLIGLFVVGLGCSTIVPSLIHSVPELYGHSHTSTIVGIDMAFAHAGSAVLPPLFGVIAEKISIRLFPLYIFVLTAVLLFSITKIGQRPAGGAEPKRIT